MLTHACLMWRVVVLGMIATSCTEPNPRFCGDGACSDPRFPFCDVDGAVAGQPDTCIEVNCQPDSFEVCRGDNAIVCNSSASNFEVVECALGCNSELGCLDCTMNDDCSN